LEPLTELTILLEKISRFLKLAMRSGDVSVARVEIVFEIGLIVDQRFLLVHLCQVALRVCGDGEQVV
jgi:hypothetical protein